MMATTSLLHLLLLLFMFLFHSTVANLVNVTVDDAGADPYTGAQIVYEPANTWSLGPTCEVCTAHPDPKGAFNGTWHDGFFDPGTGNVLTASFQFDGTALYVNCILAHTSLHPDGNTVMSFFLDGEYVGSYLLYPDGNSFYDFDVTVYANSSIPNGHHTFTLQNGQLQASGSLVLLDSITYTRDVSKDVTSALPSNSASTSTTSVPPQNGLSASGTTQMLDSPTSNSDESEHSHSLSQKDRTIAIAVSVVGGVVLISLIVVLILWWRRRRYQKYNLPAEMSSAVDHTPMEDPNSSGWVEGTWSKSDEPVHPSLMPQPGAGTPRRDDDGSGNALTPSPWSQPSADHSVSPGVTVSPSRNASATALSPPPSGSSNGHDRVNASAQSFQGSSTWHGHESPDDGNTIILHGPLHPFALATPSSPSFANTPRTPPTPPSVVSPTPSSQPSSRSETPLIAKFKPNRRAVIIGRSASAIASIPEDVPRTETTTGTNDRAPHRSIFLDISEESRPPSYNASE